MIWTSTSGTSRGPRGCRVATQERAARVIPGWVMFVLVLIGFAVSGLLIAYGFENVANNQFHVWAIVLGVWGIFKTLVACSGFTIVQPNETKVVTFLGRYLGTIKRNGWGWTWPFTSRNTISQRIQNFDSEVLKVNDAVGNPIEVAAVVVWRVVDTARASFDVEDYEDFVRIQTETAVRHMTSLYPYDQYESGQVSLRSHADEVTTSLNDELQEHLKVAGVEVLRTQLRRLAYAPEIASEMLRRQQAEAVVSARTRIVEGAVLMVEDALTRLSEQHIVELDEEKKAAMVSNLLVVLCSDNHVQPVVNAGSLYQ
jgi:regulator of protease activity HflC (stomatin/prohibitin superfamily)